MHSVKPAGRRTSGAPHSAGCHHRRTNLKDGNPTNVCAGREKERHWPIRRIPSPNKAVLELVIIISLPGEPEKSLCWDPAHRPLHTPRRRSASPPRPAKKAQLEAGFLSFAPTYLLHDAGVIGCRSSSAATRNCNVSARTSCSPARHAKTRPEHPLQLKGGCYQQGDGVRGGEACEDDA